MGFVYMNFVSCCCCLVILGTLLHAATSSDNPGIKLRLSEKGLSYAAGVGVDSLVGKVLETKIKDQSGKVQTPVGKVDYTLSAITIKRFTCSSKSVTVNPGAGLTLMLRDIGITIQGNWGYSYKRSFIRIRDDGTFEGSITQSTIDVSVTLGMDSPSHGRPTIRSTGCDCRLGAIDIKLSGGASWLYNVFLGQLDGNIRGLAQDAFCQRIRRAVDEDTGSRMSSLQVVVPLADDWSLDLGLVEAPRFQPGFMEFALKGQFVHKDDVGLKSPFTADPFQLVDSNQMATIGISEYALKTVGYALFRRGVFRHNLIAADLPDSERNFLRTTGGTSPYFGGLVPAVGAQYPNASVELELTATRSPDALVSVKGVRCSATFSTTFRARTSDGSLSYLLTTNVSATVGLTATVNETALWGNLTGFVPTIAVTDSAVGPVNDRVLQTVFSIATRYFIVPRLNVALQKGVPVQKFGKFRLSNQELETRAQFLQIRTDVLYEPGAE